MASNQFCLSFKSVERIMNTILEPFSLHNPPMDMRSRRQGFRVPFGLRGDRVWAPAEVERGKACGCVCPACGAPLAAKAQASRRRRAHFAHLADTGCQTGAETGIHMRAKQLILERKELLLPGWHGDLVDMPNPPRMVGIDGIVYEGRRVDYPQAQKQLRDLKAERWFGEYKPDVYGFDDEGELLIEIRVSHAVDERKAARVQAHGRRMVEIDLSHLDRDVSHDIAAFERAVISEPANRIWISCPKAIEAWHASRAELEQQLADRNRSIAEQRAEAAKAAQVYRDRAVQEAKDKAARKDYVRRIERAKHAGDLAALPDLVAAERIRDLLRNYQMQAAERVSQLLAGATPAVRSVCLRAHPDAWIYGVDPVLWQLLAHEHFVGKQVPGFRFNQRDIASWVMHAFPCEPVLRRLFFVQYSKRADARRNGYWKRDPRDLDYWIFTDEENRKIPNFFVPINDFVDRMVEAHIVRHLPDLIGECEVCAPPVHGHFPVAAVDAGRSSAAYVPPRLEQVVQKLGGR
jgi:hypothetical protein